MFIILRASQVIQYNYAELKQGQCKRDNSVCLQLCNIHQMTVLQIWLTNLNLPDMRQCLVCEKRGFGLKDNIRYPCSDLNDLYLRIPMKVSVCDMFNNFMLPLVKLGKDMVSPDQFFLLEIIFGSMLAYNIFKKYSDKHLATLIIEAVKAAQLSGKLLLCFHTGVKGFSSHSGS